LHGTKVEKKLHQQMFLLLKYLKYLCLIHYRMKIKKFILVSTCFIMLACSEINMYDTVVLGGEVYDPTKGTFQKINFGVIDGKIAVKSNEPITGKDTIDATGQFVYPGLIDAHCHFVGYAAGLMTVNLVGCLSFDEMVERTLAFSKANPDVDFIIGRGWNQNLWPDTSFPENDTLNILFPANPVFLTRIDGHAALVNDAALKLVGILPEFIEGGKILRKNNKPTGILIDKAMDLIEIPTPPTHLLIQSLLEAEKQCFAFGLTSLADAGLDYASIMLLDSLYKANLLRIPINAMISDHPDNYFPFFKSGPLKTERLQVRGIKVYGDGALGSRGAYLLAPYSDDAHNRGLLLTDKAYLLDLGKKAFAAGFQVNVHAIGDAANRMVLETFAEILPVGNDNRWRVEHAQVVNPDDMHYFSSHKIIPSVQPTHATSDMPWAETRLGAERIWHAYNFKGLLGKAGTIALGTDFPVEDIDPRKTFFSAVVGWGNDGKPFEKYDESKLLSRQDALRGMTIWAAHAQFEENEKGSLDIGKWGDYFITSTNLLTCKPQEILQLQVQKTFVHGQLVFTKP